MKPLTIVPNLDELKDRETGGVTLDQDELEETDDETPRLNEHGMWGALAGHVFVQVMPPNAGEEDSCGIALNPANVLVRWQADNKKKYCGTHPTSRHGRRITDKTLCEGNG